MEKKNENEPVMFEQNGAAFACSQEKEEMMRNIAEDKKLCDMFDFIISF